MFNVSVIKQVKRKYQPKKAKIIDVVKKSLIRNYNVVNIEIVFVSLDSSQQLNNQYRGQNKPTNVISLEYQESRDNFNILNGQLYLCDDIILEESLAQNKSIESHYIHMIIHGILHIQGFDHMNDEDAKLMEDKEIAIMDSFGYANPYLIQVRTVE